MLAQRLSLKCIPANIAQALCVSPSAGEYRRVLAKLAACIANIALCKCRMRACACAYIYIYVVLFRSTLVHINITSHQHQDATVCVLHPCDCLEIVFIYYLQPDWLKAMQSTNISCENSHWMWESESATTNCCALATAPKVQVSENMWWLHSHYL